MELVPTPEASAPAPLHRRLLSILWAQRKRIAVLAGSAALGWFCRTLPEGTWRDLCTSLASFADTLAGLLGF